MTRRSVSILRTDVAAGSLVLGGIAVFVLAALIPLLMFGVQNAAGSVFSPRTFSVLHFTLWQAFLSTALSLLFAIPAASALVRRQTFAGRIWIIRLMAAPMGLPALVGAFGILAVWGRQGIANDLANFLGFGRPLQIYGLAGILIAHVFFNLPLATRLLLAGLERLPPQYWKLSSSLGMSSWQIFRLVELPAILRLLPGVAGLIFMLCATSFTLVLLLGGGPAATTLEVAIYQALKFDFDPPMAVALSVLQITILGVLLGLMTLFPKAEEDRGIGHIVIQRFDGRGSFAKLFDGLFLLVFCVFCGSPLLAVVFEGIGASFGHVLVDPMFWQALVSSLIIGAVAAGLSVAMAFSLSGARASLSGYRNGFAGTLSGLISGAGSLILVLPPVVLATGWFLLLKGSDGMAPFVLVAIINALMALPFAFRVLEPAVVTHRLRSDRLALSLDISGLNRFFLIDLPVLRKPLLMAYAFAAALSLGDLGAVALFGGNQIVTLPWLMYARLGSYRTDDAAVLALMLAIVCMGLAVLGAPQGRTENRHEG